MRADAFAEINYTGKISQPIGRDPRSVLHQFAHYEKISNTRITHHAKVFEGSFATVTALGAGQCLQDGKFRWADGRQER